MSIMSRLISPSVTPNTSREMRDVGSARPHRLGQQDLLQPLVGLVALPEQAHPLTVRELLDLLVGLHVWEAKHRQDEWVVSGRQLVHNVIVQIQSGEPGFVDGR